MIKTGDLALNTLKMPQYSDIMNTEFVGFVQGNLVYTNDLSGIMTGMLV